ncbi:MAG: PEP-CTERM sorting domain-containing protein [Candidatus Solibacter sp.]
MKIITKAVLAYLMTAIAGSVSTYSAWGDFSNTNPSGVWKYGSVAIDGAVGALDVSFTSMPTFQLNCASGGGFQADCWQSSAFIAKPNGSFGTGTVSYVTDYLNLHPSSAGDMSVLAFTAPMADVFTFLGEWADHDIVGGGGVEVWTALGDGTILAHNTMPAVSGPIAINFSQSLAAGQSVYFVLGFAREWTYDSTGLKLDVSDSGTASPEPGSMLLVGLGAAAVWLKRRAYAR